MGTSVVILMLLMQMNFCMSESAQVTSQAGTFIGVVDDVNYNLNGGNTVKKVASFLGIPYAKPPIGNLRFSKPVAMEPLSSPYNATAFGNICTPELAGFAPREFPAAEDCLFLNIYKPSDDTTDSPSAKPVLVFLHGGFHKGIYKDGASNFYPGDVLSAFADVIVVTLNYRLGVFGFFSTGNDLSPGNYGLWDQHLALKWVHDNIASFGGSPDNVTLVGQQTGSVCAIYQALYPGNKGLFQRVIAQSGSPTTVGVQSAGPFIKKPDDTTVFYTYGCLISTDDNMGCMRNYSYDKFKLLNQGFMGSVQHTPVYDGEFVKADPKVMLDPSNEQYKDVQEFFSSLDAMIGYNDMDGISYMQYQWRGVLYVLDPINWKIDPEVFTIDESMFEAAVNKTVQELIYGRFNDIPNDVHVKILQRYNKEMNQTNKRDVLLQYSTDFAFMMPTINLVSLRQTLMTTLKPQDAGKTYLYKFDAQPGFKYRQFPTPNWATGATTGDELPFLFGFSEKLLDAFNVTKSYEPSAKEKKLSSQMMTIWSAFASGRDLESLQGSASVPLPQWPDEAFRTEHKMAYYELSYDMNATNNRREDLEGATVPFWRSLQTYIDDTERERNKDTSTGHKLCLDFTVIQLLSVALLPCAFRSLQ